MALVGGGLTEFDAVEDKAYQVLKLILLPTVMVK
jgi:hypothetical protein